jgi:regulator of sirC expression with transglutaminase-like and TPR domain
MATVLSVLCERIIEAGWLVALVVTPLFFNVYSNRIFEPDKLVALQCIVLAMALAWLVKGIDAWWARRRSQAQPVPLPTEGSEKSDAWSAWFTANPVACLALCFFAVYALATATSIAPRLSLWGSYDRLQGLYTTAAYLVVFFALVTFLRSAEQVERLISTALVVSVPVSLYGIIQHFGTDPVPWSVNVTQRVASTLGNPIFVAAFLSMIVPLTLYRHVEAARHIKAGESRGMQAVLTAGSVFYLLFQVAAWWIGPSTGTLAALTSFGVWMLEARLLHKPVLPFIRIGSDSVILSMQLAGILLSQSRGPWLGLLAGLLCFALCWLLTQGRRRRALLLTGGSIVVVLLLVALNLPDSPLSFVRTLPHVGRLGRVFESTGQVRLLIWQGTTQLVMAQPMRTLIGYGPEAMMVAYPPYYPPALGQVERRTSLPDRAHNEIFDVLVTTGFLGLMAFLAFCTSLLLLGCQALGLARSPRQWWLLLGLWCGGGISAVLLAWLFDHSWRLFGVALPLGMLTGLVVYLGAHGMSGTLQGTPRHHAPSTLPSSLLSSAVLSVILVHFVEIQFGIAIAATRTYFWALAALLVVMARLQPGIIVEEAEVSAPLHTAPPPLPPKRRSRQQKRRPVRQSVPPSAAVSRSVLGSSGLVASSLLVGWVMTTMVYGFFSFQIGQASLPSIVWLFVFTWLLGGMLTLTESRSQTSPRSSQPRLLSSCSIYVGITAGGTLLFATVHLGVLRPVVDVANIPVAYYAMMLLALLVMGGALLIQRPLPIRFASARGSIVAAGVALGLLVLVSMWQLRVIRADVYYKHAVFSAQRHGQYDRAVTFIQRAIALQPQQDFYYLFLGKTWLEKAVRSTSGPERQHLLHEAETALVRARDLHPLHPDHTANLARLHRMWAQQSDEPSQRTVHIQAAVAFYDQVTRLSPHNVLLWNEWGTTYVALGDEAQARAAYERALALDTTYASTYRHLGDLSRAQGKWSEAAQAYEEAVARDRSSIPSYSALGFVYAKMGRLADAVHASQRVVELAPQDVAAHRNLALLLQAMGQLPQALAHAKQALELAPPQERAAIEALITQWSQ